MVETTGDKNWAWATALVGGLVAQGVTHAVLSPGSRSTPLALACLRHPDIRSHVILDERVAGFFALGLAKATGAPVILVATSGSGPANWHPAVVEADAAHIPLLLLTADRPAELLDCGANQTTVQPGLFGPHLRASHSLPLPEADLGWLSSLVARFVSQSRWPSPGPVQINIPFREPLLAAPGEPQSLPLCRVSGGASRLDAASLQALAERLSGRRGVILAGASPQDAPAITALAKALDCPILADPLSGLRFGPHDRSRVMARGDLFLRGWSPEPDWVLRFGAFPVSKTIGQWLAACGAEEIVVMPGTGWSDPLRQAAWVIGAEGVAVDLAGLVRPAPKGWCDQFREAEQTRLPAIPEAAVIRDAIEELPDGGLLFLGNSMVVRDFDAFSGTGEKRLMVLGNRGVSGIDGNLSTFLGATASGKFSAALALVGDLTFLHDIGGLAAGQGLTGVICVLDNNGGGIFEHLPQSALPEFRQGWLTPQKADLAAAAAVWGHRYLQAGAADLAKALRLGGLTILHLPINRAASTAAHRALWSAAAQIEEPT